MVDTFLFAVATIVYIGVTLYLGYLGYKHTKGVEDFMVAGRKVSPVILALSYGATFISTSAIVGFGGVAAQLGMGLIWLTVLNIGLGILIAFIVYGKKTREIGHKLNAVTFPDLLGKRFNSSFMQYAVAILILISMPLYSAAILIGGARFIEATFGMNFQLALLGFALITAVYVVFGGLIAVMYTDAMQGVLMLVGMTFLLILTYSQLGGVVHANTALANMSSLVPAGLAAQGMTGWTSMPTFASPIWYTMVTTIIMGVGIGVLAQPQLTVRFLAAKNDKTINRAIAVGGPFLLLMTGVAFTVGALTNVYFYQTSGKIATVAAGGNVDSIIPLYVNQSMPELFIVVFLLTLLAAAMSTLSSIFHTMGTSAGYDLYKHVRKTDKPSKSITQIGTAVMILATIGLAFIMPDNIIARATAMFMGLSASAFLPALTYALYSKKPAALPAKLSLVVGAVVWFFWTAFVHLKESSVLGFSQFFTGSPAIFGSPYQVIDPLIIALPAAIIALLVGIYISSSREVKVKANIAE